MAQNIVKLLIRRGFDSERKITVLQDGELGYTQDINSRRLFVGDGVTPGGWPVASKFYWVQTWDDQTILGYVQINDLLFVKGTGGLYACSATDTFPLSANYIHIAQL